MSFSNTSKLATHLKPLPPLLSTNYNSGLSEKEAMDIAIAASLSTSPETGSYFNYGLSDEDALEKAIKASLQPEPSGITSFFKMFFSTRECLGGLYNVGNTCWLNATLQAIFKPQNAYSRALQQTPSTNTNAQLVKTIIDNSKKTPSDTINKELERDLRTLRTKLGDYSRGRQEDPNEVFSMILTTLLGIDGHVPTIASQAYIHAKNASLGSFNTAVKSSSLTLAHSEASSLQDAINRQYMHREELQADESYDFKDGTGKQDIYKVDYLLAESVPDSLLIQAPRFNEIPSTNRFQPKIRVKNNKPIFFNETLELSLYDKYGTRIEKKLTLSLQSVIAHRGGLNGGHYIAYTRQASGSYICYNDLTVSILTAKEAQEKIREEGYIGVYVKTKVDEIALADANQQLNLTHVLGRDPILPQSPHDLDIESRDNLKHITAQTVQAINLRPASIVEPAQQEKPIEVKQIVAISPISTTEKASQIARSIIEHNPTRSKKWESRKISEKYSL